MKLNKFILFLQLNFNILLICLILLVVRKESIEINLILLVFFILFISCIDFIFLYASHEITLKKFLYFNLSRYIVFFIGYLIFYFAYFFPNDGIISVILPEEYFDSGMYVYVAKNLAQGLSVAETDFSLYYGTAMSPNWALIVYIYSGIFFIFGAEEQVLPMINLFLYSYLYFFFLYILKLTNLRKHQIYRIVLFMMLLPGPLYWAASLSKEVIYYLFLSMIMYLIINTFLIQKNKIGTLMFISFFASIFSRFNIIAISFFCKIISLSNVNSKKTFFLKLFKIYIIICLLFAISLLMLDFLFGIDFYKSAMYIPAGVDVYETWGSKMDYVPMSLLELTYKLPIKMFFTVFSEVNFFNIFTYPYGDTNSYATLFNIFQGTIRIILILVIIKYFIKNKNIDKYAFKFISFTFIFWLLFSISIGFFQSRYIIFADYLLIFSVVFIKYGSRGNTLAK
jgi:hypothetical protein